MLENNFPCRYMYHIIGHCQEEKEHHNKRVTFVEQYRQRQYHVIQIGLDLLSCPGRFHVHGDSGGLQLFRSNRRISALLLSFLALHLSWLFLIASTSKH